MPIFNLNVQPMYSRVKHPIPNGIRSIGTLEDYLLGSYPTVSILPKLLKGVQRRPGRGPRAEPSS